MAFLLSGLATQGGFFRGGPSDAVIALQSQPFTKQLTSTFIPTGIATLSATALATPASTAGWTSYTTTDYVFSIAYPATMQTLSGQDAGANSAWIPLCNADFL